MPPMVLKRLAGLVAALAVLALTADAAAETARLKQAVTVRERPGDSYRAVGKLPAGARVEIGRRKDDWVKLEGGRGGWIPAGAVAAGGAEAPVARARPKAKAKPAAKTRKPAAVAARRKGKRGASQPRETTESFPEDSGRAPPPADASNAAAAMEWGGGSAPPPAKRARLEPPPEAEESAAPPPRRVAAAEAEEEAPRAPVRRRAPPPAEEEAAAAEEAPPAEEERPRGRRRAVVAQADDEGDGQPRKKKRKKRGAEDEEEGAPETKPGPLWHLGVMAGYHSWHEKVVSDPVNDADYDVPVGAFGVVVDGGVGFRSAAGLLVYADGLYRYFGANPGLRLSVQGMDETLGVLSHHIEGGLRVGFINEMVAAYGRLGYSSDLVLVSYSVDRSLPSEKMRGVTIGGGVELPHLGDRVMLRVRADYAIAPHRIQYANCDQACANDLSTDGSPGVPYASMADGESQTTVAWSASSILGVRLVQQFGLLFGLSYRFVDSQFAGASERVPSAGSDQTVHRTSTMLMVTGGVGWLWR